MQNLGILFPETDDQFPKNTPHASEKILFDRLAEECQEPGMEGHGVLIDFIIS